MNNNLDESWKNSLTDKNSSISRVYLLGASDFQRKALEYINSELKTYEGNCYDAYESGIIKGFNLSLEILTNLKYETKINSDS